MRPVVASAAVYYLFRVVIFLSANHAAIIRNNMISILWSCSFSGHNCRRVHAKSFTFFLKNFKEFLNIFEFSHPLLGILLYHFLFLMFFTGNIQHGPIFYEYDFPKYLVIFNALRMIDFLAVIL